MSYKEELTSAMREHAATPGACFIGYGLRSGRALGTLKDVPESQIIETPVAENLMVGLAIGLALLGQRPLVFIERMDFILNAADAIVNHLDKIATMSRGEFTPGVIIRAVVGNKTKPLFTGETHTQDFTWPFRQMLSPSFAVKVAHSASAIADHYWQARRDQAAGYSSLIVEYKDLI